MTKEEAIRNAIESGTSAEDIAADLADDGVLNNSHLTGVLATEKNTSALDKATETAEKIHKLLITLVPILILLAGSGLELGGIIDFTPAGEGDDWAWEEDTNYEEDMDVWGCTDYNAVNYDYYANMDDGSCYYEDDENDPAAEIVNMKSEVQDDSILVSFDLLVDGDFVGDIEITWRMSHDGEEMTEMEQKDMEDPYDQSYYEKSFGDLESGDWVPKVIVRYNGEYMDEETFPEVTIEEDEPPACQWIIWRGEPGDNITAPALFHNSTENTTTVRFDIDENKNCGEYWITVYVGAINNAGDWIEEQSSEYLRYGQKYENDTLVLSNLSCGVEYDIYIALYDNEDEYADQFIFDNAKRECEV